MAATGSPTSAGDPPPVRWALWVRARIRSSVVLGDDRGEHLAELELKGWPRRRRRVTAVDQEERRWTVDVREGPVVVACEGERRLTAEDDALEVDGRRLRWPVREDRIDRRAVRRAEDDEILLRLTRTTEKQGPVAMLDLHEDLPAPFVVALAACAVHLRVHGHAGAWDALDPGVALDAVGGV